MKRSRKEFDANGDIDILTHACERKIHPLTDPFKMKKCLQFTLDNKIISILPFIPEVCLFQIASFLSFLDIANLMKMCWHLRKRLKEMCILWDVLVNRWFGSDSLLKAQTEYGSPLTYYHAHILISEASTRSVKHQDHAETMRDVLMDMHNFRKKFVEPDLTSIYCNVEKRHYRVSYESLPNFNIKWDEEGSWKMFPHHQKKWKEVCRIARIVFNNPLSGRPYSSPKCRLYYPMLSILKTCSICRHQLNVLNQLIHEFCAKSWTDDLPIHQLEPEPKKETVKYNHGLFPHPYFIS